MTIQLAEMIVPPSPGDFARLAFVLLVLPAIAITGAILLRRQRAACLSWLAIFAVIYAFVFLQANPATSLDRTNLTLIVKDLGGRPVPRLAVGVMQFAPGDDQPLFHSTAEQSHTTDAQGRVTIPTTPKRKILAHFRGADFRPVDIELDRAWKPTFQEGQFFYRWRLRSPDPRSSTGVISSHFARELPLEIELVLPAPHDDDAAVEARMRALLPKGELVPRR